MKAILAAGSLCLAACAATAPRPHYAALLSECRADNERVTADKMRATVMAIQCAAFVDHHMRSLQKLCEANRRPVRQAFCDEMCDLPEIKDAQP